MLLSNTLSCKYKKSLEKFTEIRMPEITPHKTGQLSPTTQTIDKNPNLALNLKKKTLRRSECAARLYKTNRGGARHFPPHSAEVEAIEHNTTEIMHKVFLGPDQIEEIVDVESSSKARDICVKIGKKLGMKSIEGFSLFVRILDKGNYSLLLE